MALKFSVVVSTHNRLKELRDCLRSLQAQDYPDFEVVVVVGPCTDETLSFLEAEYRGRIKVKNCPELNLCKSRNIGIEAASGEIIAFIDDDSVATPSWLSELAAGYATESVAGVGGIVFDHTGRKLQYRYSMCNRLGQAIFSDNPPPVEAVAPGADPFVYLQGTNASFRKAALVAVGGFNEQIVYYHDETDVCLRVIDKVGSLVALDGAAVHHRYAASDKRDHRKIVYHPHHIVRSQHIFALQNGTLTRSPEELFASLERHTLDVRNACIHHSRVGDFTEEQARVYQDEVKQGIEEGISAALNGRANREFAATAEDEFLPFQRLVVDGKKLRLAFVSSEYPPEDYGGIGRFTFDLATGFANLGHDVHVVTFVDGPERTDFDDGIWVHRLSKQQPISRSLTGSSIPHNLLYMGAVYREVDRIHSEAPLDLVSAPIWNSEGALVACDPRFPTVMTLMTPMKVVADMHPSWADDEHVAQLLRLEKVSFKNHKYAHAISRGILERLTSLYGEVSSAAVVPLGVRDVRDGAKQSRPKDRIRVLFVGRMEVRKGIDTLLDAAVELARDEDVEFFLVGKDTPNSEIGGRTYRELFEARTDLSPEVRDKIRFVGSVTEAELSRHYEEADILCLPSRYESFGLVLLEGAVFELPLIAANVGGMCEIVEHDKNGLLFNVGDSHDLAQSVRALVSDSTKRKRLGARAREDFEKRFSLDVIVPQTVEYYTQIAEAHPRADASKEVVAQNFERILTDAAHANVDNKIIACELVGMALPESEKPRRSVRALLRSGLRRCYSTVRSVPVLGGVAYECARAYKTYRAVQRAFLDQSIGEYVHHAHAHAARARHLMEEQVNSDAAARYRQLIDQQARSAERAEQAQNIANVVEGLQQRFEFVRNELMFEMRDALGTLPDSGSKVEARIKDTTVLDRTEMKLNIGCGHAPLPDYVNVDRRDVPGVDIVAEATDVPLDPATVDEIFSSHLLEHFPVETLRRSILPHWHSLLKPGGVLSAVVPDAEAMLTGYQEKSVSFDELRTVLYGLQEYEGDFHFNMFSRESLSRLLEDAGFEKPEFAFVGRRNGMCFDMHIIAVKRTEARFQSNEVLGAAQ